MTTQLGHLDLNAPEQEQEEMLEVASLEHGIIGGRILRYLGNYVEDNELGYVFNAQTTFALVGTPPARYPDGAFVSKDRMPANHRVEVDFAPDLAVEVVSKNDTYFGIVDRVIQYQKSGVRLIWIIDPLGEGVDVYRLADGLKSQSLLGDDELDGEDVILGFKLPVKLLFTK